MSRSPARPTFAFLGLLALLSLASCAPMATVKVPSTATATLVPATATALADCSSFTPDPVSPPPQMPIVLPPNTVWEVLGGAAGASFYLACTSGATPDAIDAYLNAELPHAGWQRWDPQTESTNGCAETNSFWRWSKGGEAVGWSHDLPSPSWRLGFCNLSYGR